MIYAGMTVRIVDAQDQRRTPRDVPGAWIRPRVPPKRHGRNGTRRAWKRANPPHRIWLYREPDDVLVIHGRTVIVTHAQAEALRRAINQPPKALCSYCSTMHDTRVACPAYAGRLFGPDRLYNFTGN